MRASEKIVYLLAIVQSEDMLSAWVYEILINVIHFVVQNQISNSKFMIVSEIVDITVEFL